PKTPAFNGTRQLSDFEIIRWRTALAVPEAAAVWPGPCPRLQSPAWLPGCCCHRLRGAILQVISCSRVVAWLLCACAWPWLDRGCGPGRGVRDRSSVDSGRYLGGGAAAAV